MTGGLDKDKIPLSKYVGQRSEAPTKARTDTSCTGSGSSTSAQSGASGAHSDKGAQWLGCLDPGNLGCLVVVFVLGLAIPLLGRDLLHTFRGNAAPVALSTVAAPACPALTPAVDSPEVLPPRSRVILGADGEGVMYYFEHAQGVYTRKASAAGVTQVVPLADFVAYHWSPTGDKIAFVSDNRRSVLPMLYVVDLEASDLALASPYDPDRFPADFGLRATSPLAWSPDGAYVAFVAYDSSHRAALFVSEVTSGTVTRLTEGSEPVTSVGWEIAKDDQGGDVQRIVYAQRRAGETHLYTVEPNGANRQRW